MFKPKSGGQRHSLHGARHVATALVLATLALAGLSVHSIYREARLSSRLVMETHRSIADVVSAQLDASMEEADRAIGEVANSQLPTLRQKLQEIEIAHPWLRPLALVSTVSSETAGHGAEESRFSKLLASAEQAEHQAGRPTEAARWYALAAGQASNENELTIALNGQARSELKAGDARHAAETYNALIEKAPIPDPEQTRFLLIARFQLVSCYKRIGIPRDFAVAALDLYGFLIGYRSVLEEEDYEFYRGQLDPILLEARQNLDRQRLDLLERLHAVEQATPLSTSPQTPLAVLRPIGAGAAHVWNAGNIEAVLKQLLAERPGSDVNVKLVEDAGEAGNAAMARATHPLNLAPHWRLAAYPKSGSMDTLASHEIVRFAILIALVFGTVVAALVLASRGVARELALSRTRSEFVAGVSHELKTPLSLIRMFAESLREGWVPQEKLGDYYEAITRESERLTGLINNVLDFSRIESGTRKYQRTVVDLRGILSGLLNRYRYHLSAARIELREELPPDPVLANVDSEAIEQVLVNLLSNAVKYMGDRGQRREVHVSLDHDGQQAVIRIADTGIGISEEHRPRIFDRFWRADDERVRSVAGSGLGLTLVKHIVEAHEGTIAVQSVPGSGSTFAVKFPLAAGAQP